MLAGPPLFHPRGMGPRGMRPNMRTPFGPGGPNGPGGPRGGPPFEPRDGPDMPFFRPDIFDEGRGPIGGVPPPIGGRPGLFGVGPEGRMGGPPGSLLGNVPGPGEGPWRNDGGPPMPMVGREGPHGPEEDSLQGKEKQPRSSSADREKRRENRKSRLVNLSLILKIYLSSIYYNIIF